MENEKEVLSQDNSVKEVKTEKADVISVKDWVITLLITMIPIVNKANWAKANLIWMAIGVGLSILFIILISSMIVSFRMS